MVTMIPHSSVLIQYATSGGAVSAPTYYGVLTGAFKDVHKFYEKPNAFYDTALGYDPSAADTRLEDFSGNYINVNKYVASVTPDNGFPYPGYNSYFTPDYTTSQVAFDNIIWRNQIVSRSTGEEVGPLNPKRAWYYNPTGDTSATKFIPVASTGVKGLALGTSTTLNITGIPNALLATMVLVITDSADVALSAFIVPITTMSILGSTTLVPYNLFGPGYFLTAGGGTPEASITLTAGATTSDVLFTTSGAVINNGTGVVAGAKLKVLWVNALANVYKMGNLPSSDESTFYTYLGASDDATNIGAAFSAKYTGFDQIYTDEFSSTSYLNRWQLDSNSDNWLLAQVDSFTDEIVDGEYSVINLKSSTMKTTVLPWNLVGVVSTTPATPSDANSYIYVGAVCHTSTVAVYETDLGSIPNQTYSGYLVAKYSDLYADLDALYYEDDNTFNYYALYAKAHIEYLGDFSNTAYLNRVFDSTNTLFNDATTYPELYNFGKPHPDNPLGLGFAITKMYNPSTTFRVALATTKSLAFSTIEKYRELVYVANLWDEFGQGGLNEQSWLTTRKTTKSDYRIVITWKQLEDRDYKVGDEDTYSVLTYSVPGKVNYCFNNSETFVTKGVQSGDYIEFAYPDGSTDSDIITSATETTVITNSDFKSAATITFKAPSLKTAAYWLLASPGSGGAFTPGVGGSFTCTFTAAGVATAGVAITPIGGGGSLDDFGTALALAINGCGNASISACTYDAGTNLMKIVSADNIELKDSVTIARTAGDILDTKYTLTQDVSTVQRSIIVNSGNSTDAIVITNAIATTTAGIAEYVTDVINRDWLFTTYISGAYDTTGTGTGIVNCMSDKGIDLTTNFTITLSAGFTTPGGTTDVEADSSVAYTIQAKVYEQLTSADVKTAAVAAQSSTDPELIKILNKQIVWAPQSDNTTTTDNEYIDPRYFVAAVLGQKIALPEQKPLSNIGLDSGSFEDVTGSFEFFTEDELDELVGAGYYMYAKEPNGLVYCIREATCGLKTGDVFRGNLNAVTPVVTFAYSIYTLTKKYLGQFNITEETKEMIKLAVGSIIAAYTTNPISYLGTKLKKATITSMEEMTDGIKIYYNVTPQRSLNVIENVITVTSE